MNFNVVGIIIRHSSTNSSYQILVKFLIFTKLKKSMVFGRLNTKIKLGIFFLPFFFISILILLRIFLGVDSSEYREILREDGPIEYATTIFLFCSAVFSGLITSFFHRTKQKLFSLIYLVVTLGLVFFAFEEISWGQRIFDLETPDLLSTNLQGETNIHNLDFIQKQRFTIWMVVGLFGTIGWTVFPKTKNEINNSFATFLIPKWFLSSYFVPVLVYNFSVNMLVAGALPRKIFVYLFPFRDSEIGEFLFSLAILFFMVTNYFSNKS